MRGFVSLFLLMMTCSLILSQHSVNGVKRKFAPAYCLRLKFNCQRESHADHICCKFPLPEGDEAEAADAARPHPFIKIRPITTNNRPTSISGKEKETEEGEEVPEDSQLDDTTESSSSGSTSSTTTTTTNRPSKKGSRTRPNINSNVQPRICKRITVNCVESPEHRCCQHASTETTTASSTTTATTTQFFESSTPGIGEYPGYGGEYEYSDEIPTECYTAKFDCEREPSHPCCLF